MSGPSPLGPDVRTCPWIEDSFKTDCPHQSEDPVTCAGDYFKRSVANHSKSPCLGWRQSETAPYSWINYEQCGQAVDACRASIVAAGLQKGDSVGIYSRNCPQWTIVQYAALCGGFVPVPIYDTLGPNIVDFVCNHAEVKLLFVSSDNAGKVKQVKDNGKIPTVMKTIVIGYMDIKADSKVDACVEQDPSSITSMFEFCEQGKELEQTGTSEVSLDDTFVIMYTSGTTGDPKGVVLTHRNFISSISSAVLFFETFGIHFKPGDSMLSYLPLAHIFEQQVQAIHIASGSSVGFYSGDVKLLLSDMESLKPTKFIGVPRVYARFQQRIEEVMESASFVKQTLFKWAYKRQLSAVQNPGVVERSPLWDKLVFSKIGQKLLPNAHFILTGSAPMSAQTNDFLSVCLVTPVTQGYGLTETVGGMCCGPPGKSVSGNVGGLLPGAHVKLIDVPEMGYLATDDPPRGEILVKGEFVFKEYHKNEEATQKAFDEDGFFRTGDVGEWSPDGSLKIIDRAKNIFKLSQGEYVSPDPLEQEFAKCKLVGQIYVYGNPERNNLVACVVPDVPASTEWGKLNGVAELEEIIKSDKFKQDVLKQLAEMRERAGMKKYETICNVLFDISELNDLGQGFHVDNNLMTPSFKLRRPQLKQKYGERLDALYED